MPKEGTYVEPDDSFDGLGLDDDSLVVTPNDGYEARTRRTLLPPNTDMTAQEFNNIPITIEDESSRNVKQSSMFSGMGRLELTFGPKPLMEMEARALIKKYIGVPIEQVPGTGWSSDRQKLQRARQNLSLVAKVEAEVKAEREREAAIKWAEAHVGTTKAAEEAQAAAVEAAEAAKVAAVQSKEAATATAAVATEAYIQKQAAQAAQQIVTAPPVYQPAYTPAYTPTLPVEEIVQPADAQTAYNVAVQSLNNLGLPLTDKNINMALNMTTEEMAKAKVEQLTKPEISKPFPWVWVGVGALAGLVGLVIMTQPKRSVA